MRESQWNYTLNNKLKPLLEIVWKIEANSQNGVPDNYYLGRRALWMEAKMIPKLPVRDTTKILPDCSQLQQDRLRAHHNAEDNALVIVAVKHVPGYRGAIGIPFFTPYEWENGIFLEYLRSRIMTYQDIVDAIDLYCNGTLSLRSAFEEVYLR